MNNFTVNWPWRLYTALIVIAGVFAGAWIVTVLNDSVVSLSPSFYVFTILIAALFFAILDRISFPLREVPISFGFVIVLLALSISGNRFPDEPELIAGGVTSIAMLGSLLSETWRQWSPGVRLSRSRSLVRILFYAAHHTLAGSSAAWVYIHMPDWALSEPLANILTPLVFYNAIYALVYALASRLIVWPHDYWFSRLLLPAGETSLPRVDLLTALLIAPPLLALPVFFTITTVLIVIMLLFVAFLVVAVSYVNIERDKRVLSTLDEIKQRLGSPVNMSELGETVHAILNEKVAYKWAALYSAGTEKEPAERRTVYYLRGKFEKPSDGFYPVEPRFFEERSAVPAGASASSSNGKIVLWPNQVISGEKSHLGEVALTGHPSPNVRGEGIVPVSKSASFLPPPMIALYLPILHEQEVIGLLALTRPSRRFKEEERSEVEHLIRALSGILYQVRRFEVKLDQLHSEAEGYTTDRDRFRRVINELNAARVDVFLILDLIMQSTFRNNVLSVMKGMTTQDGSVEQGEMYLSETMIKEIYKEAQQKNAEMPPLDNNILENLKLIPPSLSLAFSFRYQWPTLTRGPEFTRLYAFLVKAMEAKSVTDIVKLRAAPRNGGKEPDETIKELKKENFDHPEIIFHLEKIGQIIKDLEQNLLKEAMDKVVGLKQSVREEIKDPEKFIFLTLLGDWDVSIYTTIAEREGVAERGEAHLDVRLRNKQALPLAQVTVGLELENTGPGTAFRLAARLEPSEAYGVNQETTLKPSMLPPLEARTLEFKIEPQGDSQLELAFQIYYWDRESKRQSFREWLHLRPPPPPFSEFPSPYALGRPLDINSNLFFGRDDIFRFINENMRAGADQQRILVLIGERRIGKTSILKQLPARVKDKSYIHIFYDCQSIEGTIPSLVGFFRRLMTVIHNALEEEGIAVDMLPDQELERDAYTAFTQQFLTPTLAKIGDRRLLIAVDEFERLSADFDDALRSLMQSDNRLAFIFVGTYKLKARFFDYESILFNIAQHRQIGSLTNEEATQLITQPVKGYRVYDDLAIDEILHDTGSHPYFLQMMCDRLVNLCNYEQRSYITIQDVRSILEEVLSAGEAHLSFIWNTSSGAERDALAGLSKSLLLDAHATVDTIVRHLERASRHRTQPEIRDALQWLETRRHIVTRKPGTRSKGYYDFTTKLYNLWIQKHHSLD